VTEVVEVVVVAVVVVVVAVADTSARDPVWQVVVNRYLGGREVQSR